MPLAAAPRPDPLPPATTKEVATAGAATPAHGAQRRVLALGGPLTAVAVGTIVGFAGDFASPPVWGLAIASGISFLSLGRRWREEARDAGDPLGALLQLAFLLLLCAAAYDYRDAGPWPPLGLAHVAGLAMIAGGTWLRQSALAALGPQFTVRLQAPPMQRLVRAGPYRMVRHPNYAGLLLVAFGTAMAFSSPLAVLVAALLWLPAMLVRIVQEERLLRRVLGDDYAGYARTTWRLVPGVF